MSSAFAGDFRRRFIKGWTGIIIAVLACVFTVCAMGTGAFSPPGREKRLRARGPLSGLGEELARAFTPAGEFEPVPKPGPRDWLAQHREEGQSFEDYREAGFPAPGRKRGVLYLQPIGSFPPGKSPDLGRLEKFAEAFFSMEVECRPLLKIADFEITERKNPHTGGRQLLTGDILRLLRSRLPEDAYCMLGITMVDLYPEPSWNFVFGQASPARRVGVYSFARYDPAFYGAESAEEEKSLLLERSCKVLAHETSHVLGMKHCIYFHCPMNGSNHLAESDARPMHLCPVCLRKLYHTCGFDPAERYGKLLEFWRGRANEREIRWLQGRIEYISGEN